MSLQKKILIIVFSFFHIFQSSTAQKLSDKLIATSTDSIKTNYISSNQISITDSIINYGKIFLDTPYQYGSSGSNYFDCSGFTSYVYRNFGYNLERSSADQAQQFDTVQREDLKIGDLVFFSGRRKSNRVGHVGIVVEKKEDGNFDFIHASVQKGVTISSSSEDYYKRRFIKANRVVCENIYLASEPCESVLESPVEVSITSTPVTNPIKETKKLIPAKYHYVKKGENLSIIASKYGLSLAVLKQKNKLKSSKINPKQRLKVRDEETILISEPIQLAENIPNEKSKSDFGEKAGKIKTESLTETMDSTLKLHTVKKGETLYSISKKYNISIDDLKKMNQMASNNIHFGEKLKINTLESLEIDPAEPKINESSKPENKTNESSIHQVESGESLFSISKKYNISIDNLKNINQLASSKIQPGQKLKLTVNEETSIEKNISQKKITHKVESGESYYSIAKAYGCSVENLKEWNNKTDNKLNEGEKLVIFPKTI